MIFSKIRVLIVDDDPLTRALASDLLRRMGIHQIEEAANGKSALVAVIKWQPNLILCDIHMEPMSGVEFLKQLRALPNPLVAAIKVLVMTVDTSKETLNAVLPLGVRGYIIKPPKQETMKSKIEATMKAETTGPVGGAG